MERIAVRVKGKGYKIVRSVLMYGLETMALTLRFSLGVTRMDKIRNEYINGSARVKQTKRGYAEMVCICAEEEYSGTKDAEDGATRQEEEGEYHRKGSWM